MGTAEPLPPSRAARRRKRAHLALLGLFVVLLALWLTTAFRVPASIDKDWVSFDSAGWRALSLDWRAVYTESAGTRWPYLYPPFTIYLAVPLGLLPYYLSYVVALGSALAATAWSVRRLVRGVEDGAGRRALFVSAALVCPTTFQVLVTGQYSWIYLAAVSGAYACWQRGDERRAGRALALLLVKPNLAVFFLPFLLARRQGRALRSAAETAVLLFGLSLPFGLRPWLAFVDTVRGVAERQQSGDAPIAKQVTVQSFVRVLTGSAPWSAAVAWLLWAGAAAGLGAACWRLWRATAPDGRSSGSGSGAGSGSRVPAPAPVPVLRLLGTACLFAVAANPRLYFYDALLLLVPAAGWYLEPASYASPGRHRAIGAAVALLVGATVAFFWLPAAATVVGPASAVWLLLECADGLVAARAVAPQAPSTEALLEAA